jgi:uncharacterized protein YhfF
MELGTSGELRQKLNALVLSGHKQATAGLLEHDYEAESETLENVGEHLALLDDHGTNLAELEVTAAEIVPMRDVTWTFAQAEGEGFRSITHWREAHTRYWARQGHPVDDDTSIVCLWFRLATQPPRRSWRTRPGSRAGPA